MKKHSGRGRRQNHFHKLLNKDNSKDQICEKCLSVFTPVSQAGIFERSDRDDLESSWLRLDREQVKREREERKPLVVTRQGTFETISNTTRYRQKPGTGQIFGGRNE